MSRPQSGPPLVVPGLAFAALSIAGVVVGANAPRPGAFGLLLAGVSVPMLILGIRRPLAISGLVIAAVAEISTVVLITMNAAFTLPVGRFGGLVWLLVASIMLPLARPRTGTAGAAVASP